MRKTSVVLLSFLLIASCATKRTNQNFSQNCWDYISSAVAFRESRDFELAIKEIDKYKECNIQKRWDLGMPYYFHLGWIYFEMGRYEDSIKIITEGIPSQPDFATAFVRRGLAYEKIGDMGNAIADYKKAYFLGMKTKPTQFKKWLDENPDIKIKLLEFQAR